MKNKKIIPLLGILMLVCYACVQDEWGVKEYEPSVNLSSGKNKELTIAAAQSWYANHKTPVTRMAVTQSDDLGFLVAPSWNHAKEWRKGDYEVVEASLLTSTDVLFCDEETYQNKDALSKEERKKIKNVGRAVILKDLNTGEIITFNMIIIGSQEYLMRSDKLSNNNYLYREPNFDGIILFFSSNGEFVNGWRYQKGVISKRISPALEMFESSIDSQSLVTTRAEQDCTTRYYTLTHTVCPDNTTVAITGEFGGTIDEGGTMGEIDVSVSRCDSYTELVSYRECKDPSGNGGYGGGGGGMPTQLKMKEIIRNTDKLTEEQQKRLEKAIKEMMDKMCYAGAIFNYLVENGAIFNSVSIDPELEGNAANAINPKNGEIELRFKTEDDITFESVAHEIIHRLQHKLGVYSGLDSRGMMEYERALINDIMFYSKYKGNVPTAGWYDKQDPCVSGDRPGDNEIERVKEWRKNDMVYREWIQEITRFGIPTSILISDFTKWVYPFSQFRRPYSIERGYKYDNINKYPSKTLEMVLGLGIASNC